LRFSSIYSPHRLRRPSHSAAGASSNASVAPALGAPPGVMAHPPPPRLTLVQIPPLDWKPGGQVGVGMIGVVEGIRVGVGVRVGGTGPLTQTPPCSAEQKYPGLQCSLQQTPFTQTSPG
jgi:hypothetical protein